MTETAPQRFRRLADHFDRVVSAVPDDRWTAPSPCADWTVADVVDHVAGSEFDFLERQGLSVHAWDVARGAGLRELEVITDDDIEHSRTQLAPVGDTVRMAGIFGEPVEVPDDAAEIDKFLAWTGRRP